MRKVTSQKDPAIVLLRAITTEHGRSEHGLFVAEGFELARRAFEFGADVRLLLLTPKIIESEEACRLIELAESSGAECLVVPEGIVSKVLGAKPTPDCIVITRRITTPLRTVLFGKNTLALMVEHGENADNLGMLLRSAEVAGATGIILTADTTDPFARRVVRGSRGAVFTLPICIHQDPANAIAVAREARLQIVASSAKGETPYTQLDYEKPTLLIVGNEHVGISEEIKCLADYVVQIPVLGKLSSLNIAVAAAVLLYEAVRQRVASDTQLD